MVDEDKIGTKCKRIDLEDNHSWDLAKRIKGEQPIAHCGHGTSMEVINIMNITIFWRIFNTFFWLLRSPC
jgi:hypothetical protein